jgi:hypothetical protein
VNVAAFSLRTETPRCVATLKNGISPDGYEGARNQHDETPPARPKAARPPHGSIHALKRIVKLVPQQWQTRKQLTRLQNRLAAVRVEMAFYRAGDRGRKRTIVLTRHKGPTATVAGALSACIATKLSLRRAPFRFEAMAFVRASRRTARTVENYNRSATRN